MHEQKLPPTDRLLLIMHNLGMVHEKASQTAGELVQTTKISFEQLVEILSKNEEAGYIRSITDQEGIERYFLTGRGIIRVSSIFS